jgi:hypothetical protein
MSTPFSNNFLYYIIPLWFKKERHRARRHGEASHGPVPGCTMFRGLLGQLFYIAAPFLIIDLINHNN